LCLDAKGKGNSTKVSQQKKGNLLELGVKAKPPNNLVNLTKKYQKLENVYKKKSKESSSVNTNSH